MNETIEERKKQNQIKEILNEIVRIISQDRRIPKYMLIGSTLPPKYSAWSSNHSNCSADFWT